MKILIIDDSSTIRSYISSIFSKTDCVIEEASNGRECLIKVSKFKPDLIILDLLMPDMDGFEVLEKLKKNRINTPVIIQSADIQTEAKKECYELGAKAFINKPFKPKELLDAIESLNL